MDDPRFKHVTTDPRFKTIPRKARKVQIDSRFHSMFTDKKFKVKYAVDRRGRKVKQSSSEDLRKYYDIDENEFQAKSGKKSRKTTYVSEADEKTDEDDPPISDSNKRDDIISDGEGSSSEDGSDGESGDESSSSTDIDELTFDLNAPASEEIVHDWGEVAQGGRVPHSDETSHRLAVCNMDWDRVSANDIFVLLSSFKPRGGSIEKVTVYPSDFGLERLAREEVEGPSELVHCESGEEGEEEGEGSPGEGDGHSMEKLRTYQLNRLRYYYAVAECDSKETAEVIYDQCDGLEYECSGGQIDFRFIPDDVTFDDREPKSVAIENTIPVNFTPSNFVNTALQQSKVEMTWDETDPKRLQTTMRKFTKEDVQSMDFGAYLASSSSDDSDNEGEGQSGRSQEAAVTDEDMIQKYKALLKDGREDKGQNSAEEEMEITWEPGLNVTGKDLLKKKSAVERSTAEETTWEKYIEEKRRRKKEKRSKVQEASGHEGTAGGSGGEEGEVGFDDPFFQHDVTTATAKSKKSKKNKLSQEELEREKKEKSELELLMLEEGEDDRRQHFNIKDIMKQEKEANKKQQRKRKRGSAGGDDTAPVDGFEIDVSDPRFSALYESHLYAPDPANPLYKSTKAMEAILKERLKRSQRSLSTLKQKNSSQSITDPSIVSLVKSVKSKTSSFKEKQRKRKTKEPSIQL